MAACSTRTPSRCGDRIRPVSIGPVLPPSPRLRRTAVAQRAEAGRTGHGVFDEISFDTVAIVCLAVGYRCVRRDDCDRQRAAEHGCAAAHRQQASGSGTASPKPSRPAPRPEGVSPAVPAGFTISTYAELPAPRMMVYAPNGDLFVSSPATNTITVLRDTNNDGVFEAQRVYARARLRPAAAAVRRRGAAAAGAQAAGRAGRSTSGLQRRSAGARRGRAGLRAATRVREARARARWRRRSVSRSTTAISTSATPARSSATSTRTAI